ncbi:phytoene/squalene synthase family protein [Bradyrhizobium sp. LHD-71]|uniref:phytoene/squalene synthase family protein n=1 Tax=Bradyrhizobium sp. LHD-71 TaxID=3072141 RepID=UPI00280ECA83|nr:phytoene/squalene synthase family protein [Bradyrhizobium sp. LHD-71]MDQ8728829.1 phytoene/squalene synthase family protein [Bradyrhizobium sp. LHD-71]
MSVVAQDRSGADYCASLVRGSDFERYASTLFVAQDQDQDIRRTLLALFAFNIEIARIREQITQPLAGEIRLQWWADLLAGTSHGDAAGNPVAAELLQAIDRHALPRELLGGLIDAHRFDLYDEPMQTMQELEAYLEGTASALFRLASRVLTGTAQPDDDLMRHSGLAFGLTRIVEALPRHASRGQIYLPVDELDRANVAAQDVLAGKSTPELKALLRELAIQARQHLTLTLEHLSRDRTPVRTALLLLALLDRKLQRISSASFDPFEVRRPAANLAVLWTLWRASRREPFRA